MRYRITPEAKGDLAAIWHYTLNRWGVDQADRYLFNLEEAFEKLAEGLLPSSPCNALVPRHNSDIRFARCQSHYIIFQPQDDAIAVLAIVHTANQRIIEDFLQDQ